MIKRITIVTLMIVVFSGASFATDFKVNGVYTAWAQSQHSFTLTEAAYDHNYVVQMLRFNVQGIANENLKFVTRFDIAQGWWGVDNALKSKLRTGTGGGSALFDFKETNFLFHVDQAYVDFNVPNQPINVRIGRMWYGLGNKLMVDNNYEGIQVKLFNNLSLGWAKVSEGGDNTTDSYDAELNIDNRDADLFTGSYKGKTGALAYDAFGFFYKDKSIEDGNAYVHDHFQFFKTRFSPQVTQLAAVGLTGSYKIGKLTIDGEFNYLTGKDEIENETYAGTKPDSYDLNDGTLSGYNIYAKLNYAQCDAMKFGAVFGLGSGDSDLTGGAGNVNKLRTSGFFYITEIWEDSIMPDEEGITPQGLGAPNVRAYRELENTTIVQLNGTFKPLDKTSLFLSGSYIMASQPIAAWSNTDTGVVIDNNTTSKDIGMEVDFKVVYSMYKQMKLILRGGYFMPGDAAGYLIKGNATDLVPAWEMKALVLFKF